MTIEGWAAALLQRLGIRQSSGAMRALVGWAHAEGGHWHNSARFNPLNTTQPEPGAGNTGTQGNIKVYTSWQQGLAATVATLRNGHYAGILRALAGGDAGAVASAIGSSPWGTSGSLVARTIGNVKGVHAGANPTPDVSTSVTGTPPTLQPGTTTVDKKGALVDALIHHHGSLLGAFDANVRSGRFTTTTAPTVRPGQTTSYASMVQPAAGQVQGASRSISQMFQVAQQIDRLNNQGKVPYAWGGGHGPTPAKIGTPVDCSGFVSQILGVTPRVSGQFAASWGKPGKGHWVTVFANPTHVLIAMRDPNTNKVRWFATSRSNPGGGAGEIARPTRSYLSGFTARHPG